MPAWTSTPCWCSTTRTSTTPSSSPSPRAWARSSTPSAPACARPTRTRLPTTLRRRLQPRQEQHAVRPRRPPAAVRHRQPAVALGQLVQGRCRQSTRCCTPSASRRRAATRSSPTCAPPTMRWTRRPRPEVEDMVCEHSQMCSRQLIGFTDFTDEERERFKPVLPAHGAHPCRRPARKSLYLSSHAGGIVGWPMPEARGYLRDLDRARHPARVRLHPQMAGRRSGDVGQPPDHAPCPPLPGARAARHAPHDAWPETGRRWRRR